MIVIVNNVMTVVIAMNVMIAVIAMNMMIVVIAMNVMILVIVMNVMTNHKKTMILLIYHIFFFDLQYYWYLLY